MKDFIKYLQQKNLSASTQKYYRLYVERFLYWLDKEPVNATQKDILAYLSHLKNHRNQQNITRRNSLIALNHYFTCLQKNGTTDHNPTALIKIRGTKKKSLHHIFTFDELQQIDDNYYQIFIANFDDTHIPKNQKENARLSKQRNYALLSLLLYQGLQTNELPRIQIDDIDLIKAQIHLTGNRKSNGRTLNLHATQIGVMMNYLQQIRPQIARYYPPDTRQAFLSLPEVSKKTARNPQLKGAIKQLTRQVKSLQAHFINFKQIRASVITHWIKTYGLRKAQYMAGHRYISSTEQYLPNDLEQLTDEIQKYNPFSL